MTSPGARGGELAQLVSHHVLGDVHRDELVAVVHGDGMSHKIGGDHGTPRPGLDDGLLARFIHLEDSLLELVINKRTFF